MENVLIISEKDRLRLINLLKTAAAPDAVMHAIQDKLANGISKPADQIPSNVVTMRSEVKLFNLESRELLQVSLVYPRESNPAKRKISVLSPMGSALLGAKQGQEIQVFTPAGKMRYSIEALSYQPEAAGTDE